MTTPLVTRVNRALNPAASSSGSPGWTSLRSFGTGAAGTYTLTSSPTGPWGGTFTVCRKQWTTAQSANNGNVGYQVNADGSNYFPVAEGETITVSAYMRRIGGSSTTKTFVMRVVFYNQVVVSGAATVGSTITGTSVVADTVNTWFRPSLTVVVPAGASGMQVYPDTASVGDPVFAVGDGLDATALLIESGPVLNDYFDGSSTDTATTSFDWNGAANNSTSRQVDLIDWSARTPTTKNPLSYWDVSGQWTVLGPRGITGPPGPTGPDGSAVRTSSGGCRFRGSQTAQPSGAIWDTDNFVADSVLSTDPNPCLGIAASNELTVLRNTTAMILTATLRMTSGAPITARSCITFYLNGSLMLGRMPVRENEDTVTVTALFHPTLGDRLRVQVYLNTTFTPFGYTCDVTAALTP